MSKEMYSMKLCPTLSNKIANVGFIAACLVVSLHVSQKLHANGFGGVIAKYLAECGIGECAVPFFFIASGFFLAGHMGEAGWWGRECRKRVRSLLVPYLFWNVFYWCFMHGLQMVLGFAGIAFASDLGWGLNLGFDPTVCPQHSHLWFVRVLILAVAISPMFLLLHKKVSGIFALMAFVIMCELVRTWFVDGVSDWTRAFAISGWFRGLAFFAIGVYLRHYPIEIGRWRFWRAMKWGRGLCLVLALLPWLFGAFLARQGLDAIVQRIELPTLLTSVYFLFEAIPDSPWPKWLTSCAFPIYLIHGAVLVIFVATCHAVGLKNYLSHCSIVFYVLFWGAAIGVSIVATLLLRRIRWLSLIAFGGR